jgi:ribosomal-protein-alanine N-acetyltransferase
MKFGEITLSTDRLKLRPLELDDAPSLFRIYLDKETMKYWDSLPFSNPEQTREMISDAWRWWEAGDSIRLAVETLDSSLAIGTVSLFSFHEESKRAEIGDILGRLTGDVVI